MNLDLLNIVGVKGVTQPSTLQPLGAEEGEGLVDGGLFLSMLQEASSTETLENPQQTVLSEENILPSETFELAFQQEAALQESSPLIQQEEVTTSLPKAPKPVTLNNTIGEEIVENSEPAEAHKPVNVQLAFLMNDISKDVKIAESIPQTPLRTETPKLEEKPIEEVTREPEIKLSTKTQAPLIATHEIPKAPKRLITTAKGVPEKVESKAEEVKVEIPQVVAPAQKLEAAIVNTTTVQNNIELINSNPTTIEFVKLVPHKVITEEKPVELTSKPLLVPTDFEKFVEPLVMSYEAVEVATTTEQPIEQFAVLPSKTPELPIAPAIKEYIPTIKQQTLEHSVPQQISVNLMKSIENGKESMTFKLQPADLGEVDIKFQTTKEGVTQVSILSDKFTTFDSISRSVQQIENILHQSGFKSENLSIDVGLKEHSHQQQGKQQNEFASFEKGEQLGAEIISFKPKHDGLLNIVI